MRPVQLPTTPRMQPLIPVHRSTLPHLMPIGRQPAVHPVTIRAVQLRLRQHSVKPQEGRLTAVPNLKIGLPAPLLLLYHRRPHPHIQPLATPPGLPISTHLSKSNHRRRLGADRTGGTLCSSRRIRFNPLADRRDTDAKDPSNSAQRTALLILRQGAFLVGGARSLIGGIGDGAASAVAAVIYLAAFGRCRLWASSWSRIRGRGHRGDRRGGGPFPLPC